MSPLVARVQRIRALLGEGLVERDEALRLGLLAALAGEHFLLVGPPGTAKSLLARRLHRAFRGRYFERLLTRFTVPEELFGPLSLRGLERDVYERLGEGYLPTATIAFLDEIFKANSAILNALLGILNERVIDQGPRRDAVPLVSLVGASNELPDDDELAALSDRFVVRYVVEPVSREQFGALLELDDRLPELPDELRLDEHALAELRAAAKRVTVPPWVVEFLGDLRTRLGSASKSVYVSDRRWRKAAELLRMAALLEGKDAVGLGELGLLEHVVWLRVDDRPTVETTLRRAFVEAFLSEPERYGAIVEALEQSLHEDRAAEMQVVTQEGALYTDPNGVDTLAPSSERAKRDASGALLFRAPPNSARYACNAEQLRGTSRRTKPRGGSVIRRTASSTRSRTS